MMKCAIKTIVTYRPSLDKTKSMNQTSPPPEALNVEVNESDLININYLVKRPSQLKELKDVNLPVNLTTNIADYMSLSGDAKNEEEEETKQSNIAKYSSAGAGLRLVDRHNEEEEELCALNDQGTLFTSVNRLLLP